MSFKELKPRSGGYNLYRSSTYDGPRRQAGSPPSSPGSSAGILILGQSMKSPKPNKKAGGTKKGMKIPKVPRPARTMVMFSSVKKGLKECIEATEQDVANLRDQEPSTSAESTVAQQAKAAERYQKKLEFHLSKIEELEENYTLNQQLREGAKTMARAYTSSGSSRQTVANVKHGFKECTQAMCAIEADLENMLGTFHCKMRGMVGFARLVPGDVFEVTVRHGFQKWKSKGRVKADGQQWDTENTVFKALVGDVFLIKAVEQKSLAKSVILGQKNCDTKELFSANPQMLTININAMGSLKLSIVITWSPLEGIDETIAYFEPPPKPPSTPKRRPPISPTLLENRHSSYVTRETEDSVIISSISSSPNTKSPPEAVLRPHSNIETKTPVTRSESLALPNTRPLSAFEPQSRNVSANGSIGSRPVSAFDALPARHSFSSGDSLHVDSGLRKNKLFDMRMLADSLENTSPMASEPTSLDDALHSLLSVLEDYQGQYPELQKLEEQIQALDRMIKRNSGGGSDRSSNVSVSIEAALGAFDFLEKEESAEGYSSSNNSRRSSYDKFPTTLSLSPESTTKTADSGFDSIPNRLDDEATYDASSPSSPEPLSTTGNEQVDQSLLWHLGYCERLVENLGSFGPMKCKEIYSIDRLQTQADMIEHLMAIAEAGNKREDFQKVLDEASRKKELQDLWRHCVPAPALCTTVERFTAQLEKLHGGAVKAKYSMDPQKVFRCLCARILDVSSVDPVQAPAMKITLHQLFNYFTNSEEGEMTVDDALQDLAGELLINQRLKSSDTDVVIKTIHTFRDALPPTDCLRVAALLLITKQSAIQAAVASYLKGLCSSELLRSKAMIAYVEALEDRNADVRCAACMALGHLRATETIDQLVYMCQNDSSNVVQSIAKDTLISFGEEGQEALRQVQLSAHGFQGVRL